MRPFGFSSAAPATGSLLTVGSMLVFSLGSLTSSVSAFNPAVMCCLINKFRATQNLVPLGFLGCGNPVSALSAQLQANVLAQGHFLSNPLSLFSNACKIAPTYWVQCAAGASIWKTENDAVNAWAGHAEHRVLLESQQINSCAGGAVTGSNGVTYFSFDGIGVSPSYRSGLADPCSLVGQVLNALPSLPQLPSIPQVVPAVPQLPALPIVSPPPRNAQSNSPPPAPAPAPAPAHANPAPAPAPRSQPIPIAPQPQPQPQQYQQPQPKQQQQQPHPPYNGHYRGRHTTPGPVNPPPAYNGGGNGKDC
ncbi:hypothetical protein GQ42DRAFT_12615 [Ramicandelaber brevisporus]|nr:hypothetical protein GQ42DRAFT_12615 [Ramicandelaber brevisporus]